MKTVWRLKYLVVLGALVVLGTAGRAAAETVPMYFAISNTEHRNLVNSSYNLTTVHLTDQDGLHVVASGVLADAAQNYFDANGNGKLIISFEGTPAIDKILRVNDRHYSVRLKFDSTSGTEYWSQVLTLRATLSSIAISDCKKGGPACKNFC